MQNRKLHTEKYMQGRDWGIFFPILCFVFQWGFDNDATYRQKARFYINGIVNVSSRALLQVQEALAACPFIGEWWWANLGTTFLLLKS